VFHRGALIRIEFANLLPQIDERLVNVLGSQLLDAHDRSVFPTAHQILVFSDGAFVAAQRLQMNADIAFSQEMQAFQYLDRQETGAGPDQGHVELSVGGDMIGALTTMLRGFQICQSRPDHRAIMLAGLHGAFGDGARLQFEPQRKDLRHLLVR
jgi:hypothetical protein